MKVKVNLSEWWLHVPAALLLGREILGTHRKVSWVGCRAGLEALEKRRSLFSIRNRAAISL